MYSISHVCFPVDKSGITKAKKRLIIISLFFTQIVLDHILPAHRNPSMRLSSFHITLVPNGRKKKKIDAIFFRFFFCLFLCVSSLLCFSYFKSAGVSA